MNNSKQNALIIAYNDLNNSGVPNVIYQTIKSLHGLYDFDIIVFGKNNYYFDRLIGEGISNINIVSFYQNKIDSKLKRIFWNLFKKNRLYYKKTIKLVSSKTYNVVHSFKEYSSWPFFKACKYANIDKRILHSTVIHKKNKNPFIRLISWVDKKRSLRYATCFAGVSELCCKSSFPKRKATIIYNGYDESQFNMSVKNKLSQNSLVLTQVGTFNSNKNQLFSLNVFFELHRLYSNSRLKLIGKETESGYLKKIEKYINNQKLGGLVEVINGSNGIGNNFEYTTLTLMPSLREGAGITAIESQACGITVFASSNVSLEMDVGGLVSLDLNLGPKEWAIQILNKFKKDGNARTPFCLDKFSNKSFSKSIESLYEGNKANI